MLPQTACGSMSHVLIIGKLGDRAMGGRGLRNKYSKFQSKSYPPVSTCLSALNSLLAMIVTSHMMR